MVPIEGWGIAGWAFGGCSPCCARRAHPQRGLTGADGSSCASLHHQPRPTPSRHPSRARKPQPRPDVQPPAVDPSRVSSRAARQHCWTPSGPARTAGSARRQPGRRSRRYRHSAPLPSVWPCRRPRRTSPCRCVVDRCWLGLHSHRRPCLVACNSAAAVVQRRPPRPRRPPRRAARLPARRRSATCRARRATRCGAPTSRSTSSTSRSRRLARARTAWCALPSTQRRGRRCGAREDRLGAMPSGGKDCLVLVRSVQWLPALPIRLPPGEAAAGAGSAVGRGCRESAVRHADPTAPRPCTLPGGHQEDHQRL